VFDISHWREYTIEIRGSDLSSKFQKKAEGYAGVEKNATPDQN